MTFHFENLHFAMADGKTTTDRLIQPQTGRQIPLEVALETARNSEGDIDVSIDACLRAAMKDICDKIETNPETIILSPLEFAIFNFSRPQILGINAERAVDRYWRYTSVANLHQTFSAR